jgi:hypothetical protein
VCGKAYPAGCLDLLAIVVESPRHDRLGTIFVGRRRALWQSICGVFLIVVVSPVGAAVEVLELLSGDGGGGGVSGSYWLGAALFAMLVMVRCIARDDALISASPAE